MDRALDQQDVTCGSACDDAEARPLGSQLEAGGGCNVSPDRSPHCTWCTMMLLLAVGLASTLRRTFVDDASVLSSDHVANGAAVDS